MSAVQHTAELVLGPYQGGICEGDNDVSIELIQQGALDCPDCSGVAGQGRHSHLSHSQAGSQQAQGAARAPPTQGEDLGDLLIQQVGHLCKHLYHLGSQVPDSLLTHVPLEKPGP